MTDHINLLLEMAERFAKLGDRQLAADCRKTATRLCDYVLWRKGGAANVRQG